MTKAIIQLIDDIKVNKQNGEPAIYKPLLLLIIFNKVLNNEENSFPFVQIRKQLESLMGKYGWNTFSRKKAEYPFYFLASSSLWNINIDRSQLKHPDAPSQKEMGNAVGSLDKNVYEFLVKNPEAMQTIIKFIKDKWSLDRVTEI